MTRRTRKNKGPKRSSGSAAPAQPRQRTRRTLPLHVVVILVAAAIPFALGKYFELNSPGAFDSGAYVYSAQHILNGAEIGVEEKPSAQVGTLLVNMLGVWLFGFGETGPKLIQAIMQAAALALMFIAMRRLFGTLAAGLGVIIASVYLSAPIIAKYGNVKEQYMIACMVIGVSSFLLYHASGKWWLAILAGGALVWGPLFKQTALSAIAAVGLFTLAQPLLKNTSWRQAGKEILLLSAGFVAALAPVYIWILGWDVQLALPYSFLWQIVVKAFTSGAESPASAGDYIAGSRRLFSLSQQAPRVLRHYLVLILPITMAVASLLARVVRLVRRRSAGATAGSDCERFVLLLGCWWLLDMTFVWISPRSYEQYYLPLNASAAMLAGYIVWLYDTASRTSPSKGKWRLLGVCAVLVMVAMAWHIFFGVSRSPHTGLPYGTRQRGYLQKFKEVLYRRRQGRQYPWEALASYIRTHSDPNDTIYVWGWVPGIYVQAQRFSPVPKAFTSEMHVKTPEQLAEMVKQLLDGFRQNMPKFIVDTRKRHFPWNRPPLELWPQTTKGFLPADEQIVQQFDQAYIKLLRDKIDPEEARRYEAMKPLRQFVMKHYRIVRTFGEHVLFERKQPASTEESQ